MTRLVPAIIAALVVALVSLWVLNTRTSAQLTTATEEVARLRSSIQRTNETLEGYREAHKRDTASLVRLDKKIMELKAYAASLSDRDAVCLSDTDADRVRGLWAD